MRSPSPCGGYIGFLALLIWLQVLVLNGLVYAGGASLVVTTTQDEDDGTVDPAIGAGTSLREAVNHAQSGEHVVFDAALDGQTIALTNGQVSIAVDLTIDGSALFNSIAISGSHTSRVFDISSDSTVLLNDIVIRDGYIDSTSPDLLQRMGGGIRNFGHLTVTDCVFRDNFATAFAGAILNVTTAEVTRTSFSNNLATVGRAIANFDDLRVQSSTFWRNTGTVFGGAIRGLWWRYSHDASAPWFTPYRCRNHFGNKACQRSAGHVAPSRPPARHRRGRNL